MTGKKKVRGESRHWLEGLKQPDTFGTGGYHRGQNHGGKKTWGEKKGKQGNPLEDRWVN